MKTLKFMLAAATAIGLASASQAVGPYKGSTDFESDTLNSTITTSDAYWTVPTGAEDGDYTIVSGVPSSALRSAGATSAFTTAPAQVLQLEGGTDPLTRNIESSGAAVNLAGENAVENVYVDTLVKFTVTPAGDTVTPGADDKLMIYLAEDLTSGAEVTNLMVVAAVHSPRNDDDEEPEYNRTQAVVVASNVLPDTWHRLTVLSSVKKDSANANVPVFKLFLDGVALTSGDTALFGGTETPDYTLFPSLKGSADVTLTSVGFAGSGAVDDLLFTTFDPEVTVLDFMLVLDGDMQGISGSVSYSTTAQSGTLDSGTNTVYCYSASPSVTVSFTPATGFKGTWDTNPNGATITKGAIYTLTIEAEITSVDFTFALGTGVSGVTWTLNGTTQSGLTAQVAAGDVLAITGVTYADWYVGTGDYVKNWTKTLAAADVAADFTYTVAAEKATGPVIIADSTTATDLGITNPKFANDSAAQLSKLATWAQSLTTPLTIAQVNAMTFADGDLNSEAFLLNCENSAEAVAAAKAEFKFSAITPGTVPSVDTPARGYNVEPVIYGGATLDAITVTPATSAHKFYKAVLTK